jgi:hypothetical protein
VVTSSVTPVLTSVFPRTRPSPGKCLTVAVTPAAARPSTTVPAADATSSGMLPYWRPKAPTGSLPAAVPAGTTSATGARSRFTPASRKAAPIRPARADSSAGGSAACCRADGRRSKPGPCSDWTAPPSWSAATHRAGPADSDCHRPAVAASSAAGRPERPARNSPPTPLPAAASPRARSSNGTPATKSWATCARRSSPVRTSSTRSSGPGVCGAAVLLAAVAPARGVGGLADEHAVSRATRRHRRTGLGLRGPVVGTGAPSVAWVYRRSRQSPGTGRGAVEGSPTAVLAVPASR